MAPMAKSPGAVTNCMSDKVICQFVDTNILLYVYDITAGTKHKRSKFLVQQLWTEHRGALSLQVLQEFYVNATRKIPFPLAIDIAKQIISDLRTWRIHSPTVVDIVSAIEIQQRYQISFWDALIVRSASQLGCACIWSEDLNPGQVYEGVRVANPFTDSAG